MADSRDLEHRVPDLSDPAQRHEHRDVNIWAIGKVGIGLVLTTILSILIVFGVFHYLMVEEKGLPQVKGPQTVDARQLPPEPRLITNEPEELREMRTAEDQILNGYSWADSQHTLVKIPIDRAIDMLVQKGLPSRTQAGAQSASTASTPTDAGLGPIMQQPGGPLATQTQTAPGNGSQSK